MRGSRRALFLVTTLMAVLVVSPTPTRPIACCAAAARMIFLWRTAGVRHKTTMCCARWLPRLAAGHHWSGALFLLTVLGIGPTSPAWACDTQTDFLSELNVYVKLTDTTRLLLLD